MGECCSGWLYLPSGVAKPPVVIMAHGFGAEKTFVLPDYAERFVRAGLAVLLFDYRGFGDSQGRPRNLVDPKRHLEDWAAALAHVRRLEDVDGDRIGLWGTSFSGGHVLATAAIDKKVAAVSAQVPFVDGFASARLSGLNYTLRASLYAAWDLIRSFCGLSPFTIPVAAPPPAFAALNKNDADGFLKLVPENSAWENRFPARGLLAAAFYRPCAAALKIACPALIIIAEKDLYVPAEATIKTASRMPRAEREIFSTGHFDVYFGEGFERSVGLQTDFWRRTLLNDPA